MVHEHHCARVSAGLGGCRSFPGADASQSGASVLLGDNHYPWPQLRRHELTVPPWYGLAASGQGYGPHRPLCPRGLQHLLPPTSEDIEDFDDQEDTEDGRRPR